MTIYVKADPTAGQREGDWVVKNGNRTVSRHRKKSTAVSKGRQKARSKGTDLKIQDAMTGHWNQGPSY